MHVRLCARTSVCTYVCVHVRLCARTSVCTYVCVHVRLCARTSVCVHVDLLQYYGTHIMTSMINSIGGTVPLTHSSSSSTGFCNARK